MKTIIHVIDTTRPGGAETIFIDIASLLPADRYSPVVVFRGKGWVCEEFKDVESNPLSWAPRDRLTDVFSRGWSLSCAGKRLT